MEDYEKVDFNICPSFLPAACLRSCFRFFDLLFGSRALRKHILRIIRTSQEARALGDQILSVNRPIALDCEGVRLGRFGRLSLLQLFLGENPKQFVLVDGTSLGSIQGLEPVLASKNLLKIMHDCREDSAALFHQFGTRLGGVVDIQVANLILQREKREILHQNGYSDLCEKYLGKQSNENISQMKEKMLDDPLLWHKRPLSKELVDYALNGVEHLIPLWSHLSRELEKFDIPLQDVVEASHKWSEYSQLNMNIGRSDQVWKIGTPLLGMVAAINDRGVYFKLNLGVTGVCSTPSALKRMIGKAGGFHPVQVGDTVELAVSGVSLDGKIVYVDRKDPDWEYFDFFRRPNPSKKGTVTQEYRHIPSLIENTGIDPLLRRGLGHDGDIDSDDEGFVDHDPVVTHKPEKTSK